MTRQQVKEAVLKNLNDAGAVYYTADDLNDSIQDAYDDIVALSQCLISSITLNWQSNQTYYFFESLGATDFLAVLAVFNHNTNRFLDDSISLTQFDRIRDDWEIWGGQPEYWAPHSFESAAIIPRLVVATGQYTLYYTKRAPAMSQDADAFLFTRLAEDLVEQYVTADLLEQAEEFIKAGIFWKVYFEGIIAYKEQCKNIAKADLILHV